MRRKRITPEKIELKISRDFGEYTLSYYREGDLGWRYLASFKTIEMAERSKVMVQGWIDRGEVLP